MGESVSKRNGNGVNAKGENYPKFLKEMQALAPALNTLMTPGNRLEARALGRANVHEYVEEKAADLAEMERFRSHTVNQWFDTQIELLAPWAFRHAKKTGKLWLFKLLGYSMRVHEHYTPFEGKTLACTTALINRFGKMKVGQRFVWGGGEKPKPKKSRIVKP